MSVRIASSQIAVGGPNLVTTAETLLANVGPINQAVDNAQVLLFWFIAITIGTAGTTLTLRLRRGVGTGGTQINNSPVYTVVAGNTSSFSGCYVDTPGVAAALFYSITGQVGAATGNSSTPDTSLIAMVL